MINLQEILKLSSSERILVIEKIWDSINPKEIEVNQLQQVELDKRLARFEQGNTKFHSWESIKKDLAK
jgi:putative addiction module component (TIGR02574 family)